MRDDHFEGKTLADPELRALFTRDSLLAGPWYAAQLAARRESDVQLRQRHVKALEDFLAKPSHADEAARLGLASRLAQARCALEALQA